MVKCTRKDGAILETSLRVALAKRNLTITDVSESTGVSRKAISKLMDKEYGHAKISTLQSIADTLEGLTLVVRFEDTPPNSSI